MSVCNSQVRPPTTPEPGEGRSGALFTAEQAFRTDAHGLEAPYGLGRVLGTCCVE